MSAYQFVEREAMRARGYRNFAGDDDFVCRQRRCVQTGKKVIRCDAPLALQTASNDRTVKRQQAGRPFGSRVAVGN